MSRSTFDTGQRHQTAAVAWMRRRLIDKGEGKESAIFRWYPNDDDKPSKSKQHGVLLADGVGMGKTWEALAGAALLMLESAKTTRSGTAKRERVKHDWYVLVLCPPGLVSKWAGELYDVNGFTHKLKMWAKEQPRSRGPISHVFESVYEVRSADEVPKCKRSRGAIVPMPGVFICNWNVFGKNCSSNQRATSLLRQPWDVIIVDEAHHRMARNAIARFRNKSRFILLTATPFQLDPNELHETFRQVMDADNEKTPKSYEVLNHGPVKGFIAGVDKAFNESRGTDKPAISLKDRQLTQKTLEQLIVRTVPQKKRAYFTIDHVGKHHAMSDVRDEGAGLTCKMITGSPKFQSWYFNRRLDLADRRMSEIPGANKPTCVQVKLRQALSTPAQARQAFPGEGEEIPHSPRMDALSEWLRLQIRNDMKQMKADGHPRKTVIFTSFVGKGAKGAAKDLQSCAEDALQEVMADKWSLISSAEIDAMKKRIQAHVDNKTTDEFDRKVWKSGCLTAFCKFCDSLRPGPSRHRAPKYLRHVMSVEWYRACVERHIRNSISSINTCIRESNKEEDKQILKALRGRKKRCIKALYRVIMERSFAATYTGLDGQRDRDNVGAAFQSPLPPFVLIASNVGSEGIDLQKYSKHLVHFDIEWNPARMEQREGRIARIGSGLPKREPVHIYHLLVKDTYDERMHQQLAARQKWHSVLLGKTAAFLAKDDGAKDVMQPKEKLLGRMTLDLSPKKTPRL